MGVDVSGNHDGSKGSGCGSGGVPSGPGRPAAVCRTCLITHRHVGGITTYLGYGRDDPVGRNGGNARNGTLARIVRLDVGPVWR
ncbi:hypothetical protein GCM10018773_61990 [Streptomyces candidus]|nr:hypothetical protein GCM10018773_61990 [Streptomyces candidus]